MNLEQQTAFDIATKTKNSIYISGPGGVGKSFLLNHIVTQLYILNQNTAVLATTGTAAVNIKGRTIHSFFGLTPLDTDYHEHAFHINTKKKYNQIKKNIINVETIVIDEISMLDDVLCNGISIILSTIRNNDKPFGGIQMIFVGDFLQLPPVKNDYCFKSSSWNLLNPEIHELKQIFRQKGDTEFIDILHNIRIGKHNKTLIKKLLPLKNTVFPDNIQPTKLYSTNVDVNSINNLELNKLRDNKRQFYKYNAIYTSNKKDKNKNIENDNSIELCVGAQIMVTRNIDIENDIVNGTRGVVLSLDENVVHIKTISNDIVHITYIKEDLNKEGTENLKFLPLKLAYAITIHKSQGATLDCMEICLDNKVFNYGQAYTGLSRAKNMQSIKITALTMSAFKTSPEVLKYLKYDTPS